MQPGCGRRSTTSPAVLHRLLAAFVCLLLITTTTLIAAAARISCRHLLLLRCRPLFLLPCHRSLGSMGRKGKPTGRGRGGKSAAATTAGAAAASATEEGWIDLRVPPDELRPEFSLTMGQCFNWKRRRAGHSDGGALQPAAAAAAAEKDEEEEGEGADEEWVGVLGRRVLCVRQTPRTTLVRRLLPAVAVGDEEEEAAALVAELRDYFQLQEPLAPLYARWAAGDDRMRQVAQHIPGVRVARQDPVECLFSFICSSNNNIARITLMLDRLRTTYGEPLGEGFHAFPSIDRLAAASEQELRELGLGYRAKFIRETAQKLQALGREAWLLGLREQERGRVQEALCAFPGVGRKVADCVALFSLDQQGAIPVDVHVWRIACRDYDSSLQASKSLTPLIYDRVGDLFRSRYGPHAGWAHSLLFAAELPSYRRRLPQALQAEMEAFKKEESEFKAAKRAEKRQRQQEGQQPAEGEVKQELDTKGQKKLKGARSVAAVKADGSKASSGASKGKEGKGPGSAAAAAAASKPGGSRRKMKEETAAAPE